jgi:fatty-acyl-CoA synthase
VTEERVLVDAPLVLGAQIEARAYHPLTAVRPFLLQGERVWSYRRYRDECVRMAHLLRGRLGAATEERPGHVAILLENHLELLALYGACGYLGFTLFGVNTGLRGGALAGVINHSRSRLLVVDEKLLPEVERVRRDLSYVAPENILCVRTQGGEVPAEAELGACVDREVAPAGASLEAPAVEVSPESNLMVIYTSGTTGLPKGIRTSHRKFLLIGKAVSANLGLGVGDVGYACMPLFHSNSMYLGFHPALEVGAALAVRERFSASRFVPDLFQYGVTWWNYVGEPVHYVLAALERQYEGDEERILREVASSPKNRLRYALGNGAAAPDIDRFTRWMGLEEMFELYGSTEAAISTFRRKGDPRGCVGEITDPNVKILSERGAECPAARIGPDGRILNYAEAVGEICRVAPDTGLFEGYFEDSEANRSKYREGVYHSGDLGHVVLRDGKRYLFFDGRTDDWIRKDGENFSAAQVARILMEHPDVQLAVAYGVPCAVSDELVMVGLKLRGGVRFDPKGFFEFCERQVREGGMDPKWLPDFVVILEDFEYTETQKVLVRNLKRVHFDRRRIPDAELYWRRRGDMAFHPFTAQDYEALRKEFEATERLDLLDR